MTVLANFINPSQLQTMLLLTNGDEGGWYVDKLLELSRLIDDMYVPYGSEAHADPIVTLHYFCNGGDWWVIEKDSTPVQIQCFAYCDLGDPELGYVSIEELIANGVELDLHWIPKPLSEVREV